MESVEQNLSAVRAAIRTAAERAGRDPASVRLVAVSKTHPADAIRRAFDAGQLAFGESRAQEALEKISLLPQGIEWHFIGHLQKNKIRRVLAHFALFHSVDSTALARQISRIAGECALCPRVLLEVNVSGERTKRGFAPGEIPDEMPALLELPHLRIAGLMTMAPYSENPESARPVFAGLRALRDDLEQKTGAALPELSMGMSGDFAVAIAEGATIVRVGSAIFGERPSGGMTATG
jgi:pyridoxal phosphate enzyme (YggS family)